jgi:hypothetical protein
VKLSVLVSLLLVLAACASDPETETEDTTTPSATPDSTRETTAAPTFPPAPVVPEGPLSPDAAAAVGRLLDSVLTSRLDVEAVGDLADQSDPRTAWLLADLMRFYQTGPSIEALVIAFSQLTGAPQDVSQVDFVWAMNHLIAWDLPSWDGYPEAKRQLYVPVEETWAQFFEEDRGVDWRLVTWGGVLADARPLGDNGPCNCIPALDYPEVTDAAGGDWYDDDSIVFGVVVGDEAVALPKHQMEIHEMVNLTLGDRELGIPYCTLCGSAQAYLVDDVPGVDRVVLRTSGLLQRSNKLMYDLTTGSAIDTFTGQSLTGELADREVVLEQVSVVAASWGDWKQAHPGTMILAEDGGIGMAYPDDPLRGRDDGGPIFPVGDVDARLPIQEKVVGVIAPDGTPIAFPVNATKGALAAGSLEYEGLTIRLDDGIRVYDTSGEELTSHEAFWFAWSQFHEGTLVWDEVGS